MSFLQAEEERDLEADFQESSKASKSRIKELKVLTQLMTTLATQTGSHAKVSSMDVITRLTLHCLSRN